jgi:hypothetical protein
MSASDSYNEDKLFDEEKSPPTLAEDVLSTTDGPLARAPTTPPAPLMELSQGLVGWESQSDPQNPMSVSLWRICCSLRHHAEFLSRNWPASKRRVVMTLICCITFLR